MTETRGMLGNLRDSGVLSAAFARASASALILFLSSVFLLYCTARISDECTVAPPDVRRGVPDSKIIDEAKRFSLERVILEELIFSAETGKGWAPGLFSPLPAMADKSEAPPALRLPGYAPTVVIKALAVQDGRGVCVLDIDGEKPGSVFAEGGAFGGGIGRVLKIKPDGVTWRWAGTEHFTGL